MSFAKTVRRYAGVIVSIIGLGLLLYGLACGQYLSVLRKASLICFECIGIG